MQWASDIYGEVDKDVIHGRGYMLIESETEPCDPVGSIIHDTEDSSHLAEDMKELTKESWEVSKFYTPKLEFFT